MLIDLNQIFPMKQSEFKISISVECYEKKLLKTTAIATLPISAQFPSYKYMNPKFDSPN